MVQNRRLRFRHWLYPCKRPLVRSICCFHDRARHDHYISWLQHRRAIMKIGSLVRHINNGQYGDIGIIVEAVWAMYKVLWPDGSVLPHYPHNLEVIDEAG